MRPTIREGEAITVVPVRPDAIRRGEIVLYRCGHGVLVHRVASAEEQPGGALVFVTRGDASVSRDEPVGGASVLGRVVAVERSGRTLDPTTWRARAVAVLWGVAARLARWPCPRSGKHKSGPS